MLSGKTILIWLSMLLIFSYYFIIIEIAVFLFNGDLMECFFERKFSISSDLKVSFEKTGYFQVLEKAPAEWSLW